MKFWAKANVEKESAKNLVLAFFNEFNPESSIAIRGKQARVEIVFEEPPLKILDAITNCEEYEINYGKQWEEYDGEAVVEEMPFEECGGEAGIVKEICKQPEDQPTSAEETPKKAGKPKKQRAVLEEEIEEIPEITEIAKKSSSYEDFISSIAKWIEPNKKENQIFIIKLIKAATQAEEINWKNIDKIFNNEGYVYRPGVRTNVSNAVTKKFNEIRRNVTILNSLRLFVKYQNFEFGKDIVNEDICSKRVKMKCMPEIPMFEVALGSIDKTQAIENRVKYVLNVMKLEEQNSEKQNIIRVISNVAVMSKEIDINAIYEKSGIKHRAKEYVHLTISKFVNDFAKLHVNSAEKIAAVDFLKNLQEIVLLETEVENLT